LPRVCRLPPQELELANQQRIADADAEARRRQREAAAAQQEAAAALARDAAAEEQRHARALADLDTERAAHEQRHQQELHQQNMDARERIAAMEQELRRQELATRQKIAAMEEAHATGVHEREAAFNAACAAKETRLAALAEEETMIQARAAAMLQGGPKNANTRVRIEVAGEAFVSTWKNLTRFPRSMFFEALRVHREENGDADAPLLVDGSPVHFQLILDFLRDPARLPVCRDVSQTQWLEREAAFYNLTELAGLCRDAYKRLNTVDVMQLLNGQRNMVRACAAAAAVGCAVCFAV